MSCFPSMIMLSWMHNSMRQPGGAHCGEIKDKDAHLLYIYTHTHTQTSTSNVRYWTYLLHAIVSKDINIIPRPPSKPVCREDKVT